MSVTQTVPGAEFAPPEGRENLAVLAFMRKIKWQDIKHTIEIGEIIEQYPTDYPFPSCLINGENLHIVCSVGEGCLYIITAYRPSPEQWEAGGSKKKGDIL